MLYETLLRSLEQFKVSQNDPEVVIMIPGDDDKPDEILGEIGAVMTLDDGRIAVVPSTEPKSEKEPLQKAWWSRWFFRSNAR